MVRTAAFHARVRGSVPGPGGLKETKNVSSPSTCESQGSNVESCVWRTVSSQSSHHPQEVLLAQFSLYVHKGGLKPDSFHFISTLDQRRRNVCLELNIIMTSTRRSDISTNYCSAKIVPYICLNILFVYYQYVYPFVRR